MASLHRVMIARVLPEGADIVVRNGQKFFRKKVNGRSALLPLMPGEKKYRDFSRKWYIKYKDAHGEWQRVPGYSDKEATAQLAAELERKAEQIQSGLADPHESGKLRPLSEHLGEFRLCLQGSSNSDKHVSQTCARITRLLTGCEFERWVDITPSEVVKWLATEREAKRMGAKTSNYYLAAIKQFCTWLEESGHVPKNRNPLSHLGAINADTDKRWERRAISPDEFTRLVAAAENGPEIQCVSGPDRAMLYVLAAWTGYRRGELASLTRKSLQLQSDPATVKVRAGYSKRRKNDVVPLHPEVAERLRQWLATKSEDRDAPLFALKAAKGALRRTAKMMRLDLERARKVWIEEAKQPAERERREESDFLQYQNEEGLYADFHANRHTFITNLALAGVHPKIAQSIARHSDVNLTMGIYSHVEVAKQSEAINTLAGPVQRTPAAGAADLPNPTPGDSAAESVVQGVVQTFGFECLCMASAVAEPSAEPSGERKQKPLQEQGLASICRHLSGDDASSGGGIRTPDTRIMIPLL